MKNKGVSGILFTHSKREKHVHTNNVNHCMDVFQCYYIFAQKLPASRMQENVTISFGMSDLLACFEKSKHDSITSVHNWSVSRCNQWLIALK
jgi:hypothetical protein